MNIEYLRAITGMEEEEFSEYFEIPCKTLEKWENEEEKCPDYLLKLIKDKIEKENLKSIDKSNLEIIREVYGSDVPKYEENCYQIHWGITNEEEAWQDFLEDYILSEDEDMEELREYFHEIFRTRYSWSKYGYVEHIC